MTIPIISEDYHATDIAAERLHARLDAEQTADVEVEIRTRRLVAACESCPEIPATVRESVGRLRDALAIRAAARRAIIDSAEGDL